jgi:hypothetical protein
MQRMNLLIKQRRSSAISRWWLIISLSIIFSGASASLCAANLVVTNLSDASTGSLRQTIAAASAGDNIAFAPGLSGQIALNQPISLDKNLTIQGGPGIILDGGDAVRVLHVSNGVTATLESLIIQHGLGNDGGGIYSNGAFITLRHCQVRNNHATNRGGGLFIAAGGYALENTDVVNNDSTSEGGGLFDVGSAASSIRYSRVGGNISGSVGGGVRHVSGRPLTIRYSNIDGNHVASSAANAAGGGIASQNATLDIAYSQISANKAQFAGGILMVQIAQPTTLLLNASLMSGNTSVTDGGGIYLYGAALTSLNSTIANNLASFGSGGGIAMFAIGAVNPRVSLVHTTLANNRAGANGGGIAQIAGTMSLKNTVVAGNSATSNADVQGTVTSLGNNLVQSRGTSTGYIVGDFPNNTAPQLDSLGFNGGPTSTMRLLSGSPAINAVPAAGCAGITLDQRGYRRPVEACDIGAYEAEGTLPPAIILLSGFE